LWQFWNLYGHNLRKLSNEERFLGLVLVLSGAPVLELHIFHQTAAEVLDPASRYFRCSMAECRAEVPIGKDLGVAEQAVEQHMPLEAQLGYNKATEAAGVPSTVGLVEEEVAAQN
jgi:hypothetical protein